MDFRDRSPDADAGGTTDTFPDPREADPVQVERYNELFLEANPDVAVRKGAAGEAATMDTPFAKSDAGIDGDPNWKAKFPWLHDPTHGRRWDFDPVELRVLSQENAWVQMMVQSITKEIAETSWTITTAEDSRETDKRLSTTPGERTPIQKDLPDATAEDIYDDLRRPLPHLDWSDAVEMFLRDYLEVGSMVATKAFDDRFYDDEGDLTTDPYDLEPLALSPTAPEVWTKEFGDQSGIPSGYWQFSRRSNPGASGQSSRGVAEAQHFDTGEVMWSDNSPATNRAYGDPPTLFVREFLRSVDLAVDQEQNYLSRGSIPSGAWVFEEWDRNQVLEWKEQNAENIKGKPHKSLMFAGRGGDVRFEPMSMNFQELEFTERMKWYARVIAAAFQVPTAVVGVEPEQVNYNTFQGERENFETNTLGPYLQDFERWINHGWMDHFDGYRFEFTPGFSETTKQMRSGRILQEWNADLRTREDAMRELGIEAPDDAEDGFKSDVVDQGGDEPMGGGGDESGGGMEQLFSSVGVAKEAVPENAVSISDPSEAPEDANVIEGPQGGLYYVPAGGGGGGDLADRADDDGTIEAEDLQEGDVVMYGDEEITIQGTGTDETGTAVQFVDEDGEEFFIYEDIMGDEMRVPGSEEEGGDDGDIDPPDPEDDDRALAEGQEVTTADGNPATVTAYDPDTDVALIELEDGEEIMQTGGSLRDDPEPDTDPTSERVADEVDLPDNVSVSLGELDDDRADDVIEGLQAIDDAMGIEEGDMFNLTTTPPDDVGSAAAAAFHTGQRTLYVNPDAATGENRRADFEAGFLSTPDQQGNIMHEMIHSKHSRAALSSDGPSLDELRADNFDSDEKAMIREEVSDYAATNGMEFVAEVGAGVLSGQEYSDDVMELYDELGGPEVGA